MKETIISSETVDTAAQMFDQGLKYGFDLVTAICILIAGVVLSGWAQRAVLRALNQAEGFADETLKKVIARIVRYLILIIVAVLVLAQFGVQTTSIIAVLGAAGLAVGLALQGTLSNIAAGFMLLFLRPINVGDYIDANGVSGTVDEIGLFVSHLRTFDGLYVCVPNSQIWSGSITNYSKLPTRRFDLTIGIGYEDDIDKALKVLMGLAKDDKRVAAEPAAVALVSSLDDSAVTLQLRVWTKREDYWDVRCDMTRAVKLAMDEAGISIPYPQQDVHVKEMPAA